MEHPPLEIVYQKSASKNRDDGGTPVEQVSVSLAFGTRVLSTLSVLLTLLLQRRVPPARRDSGVVSGTVPTRGGDGTTTSAKEFVPGARVTGPPSGVLILFETHPVLDLCRPPGHQPSTLSPTYLVQVLFEGSSSTRDLGWESRGPALSSLQNLRLHSKPNEPPVGRPP